MKKRTLGAIGASIALAAGAVFVAAPATAADFYYPDFAPGSESGAYPQGEWFIGGNSSANGPVPAFVGQDDAGLTLDGRTLLLYGGTTPVADGDAFVAAIEGASIDATGPTTFQFPVFFNSEGEGTAKAFTTLRPVATGTPTFTPDELWISSGTVTLNGTIVLTANTPVPFSTVHAAFESATTSTGDDDPVLKPEILAIGFVVDNGAEGVVIRSVTFSGNTHYFTAEPEEETPVGPAPAKPIIKDATYTG